MKGLKEEIVADIDTTLDQLIQNANAINEISLNALFQHEAEALQKTQESLLSRLINMQSMLDTDKSKGKERCREINVEPIQKKISCFSRLNALLIKQVSDRFKERKAGMQKTKKSVVRKNRKQVSIKN